MKTIHGWRTGARGLKMALAAASIIWSMPAAAVAILHFEVDSIQPGEPDFTFDLPVDTPIEHYDSWFWVYDLQATGLPDQNVLYDFEAANGYGGGGLYIVDMDTPTPWDEPLPEYAFYGAPLYYDYNNVPRFVIGDHWLTNDATGNGVKISISVFGADPDPSPGAVPEPASWAMTVGGFGLLGAAMRRRRSDMLRPLTY